MSEPTVVLIKKYPRNRRMWCLTYSSYACHEDILRWLGEGRVLHVMRPPASTTRKGYRGTEGDDITVEVILAALYKRAKSDPHFVTQEHLRNLNKGLYGGSTANGNRADGHG